MHAVSLFVVTALAAFALASPTPRATSSSSASNRPALAKRQFNPLTLGLGAGGVHKNRDNARRIQNMQVQIQSLEQQLANLQMQENTLQQRPNLRRRQFGTILGAVGIHESHENRDQISDMQQSLMTMRQQTNALLAAEGLAPQLQRRQLGIILSPVAIHKARSDAKTLDSLQDEINSIQSDLNRVQAAQQVRMQQLAFVNPTNTVVTQIHIASNQYGSAAGGDVDAASQSNYGGYNAPAYGGGNLPSSQGRSNAYGSGNLPSSQGRYNAYGNGNLPSSQGRSNAYGGSMPSSQGGY